jgi:hypothetical protein
METPVATDAGISGRRDRVWGLVGGVLGAAVGVGSAAIAVFAEGAQLVEPGLYPAFFARRAILGYDIFLGLVIVTGAAIAVAGVVLTRRGAYPRTDAFGALLVSVILMLLGAALLFTRLVAIVRG